MRTILLTGLLFVSLAMTETTRTSEACCMVPKTYEGTIGQSAQEAILLFDKGREELILRINYHIEGKTTPGTFAWIVTVPNEPTKYAIADPTIFRETFDWVEKRLRDAIPENLQSRGATKGAAGIELGKPAKVGPYDIQPVRALGVEALTALNTWLAENGFPTEDVDHMKYFVENKFTFLCIKVNQGEKADGVDKAGLLPPLQISFATERPYYPLKFSSRQGIFDVSVTLLTREAVDYKKSGSAFAKLNWKNPDYERNLSADSREFPKSLAAAVKQGELKADGAWKLNVIRASRVNDASPIAKWTEDIFFTLQ